MDLGEAEVGQLARRPALVSRDVLLGEAGQHLAVELFVAVAEQRHGADVFTLQARGQGRPVVGAAHHHRQRQPRARAAGVQAIEAEAVAKQLPEVRHHVGAKRVEAPAVDGHQQHQLDHARRQIGIAGGRAHSALLVAGMLGRDDAVAVGVAIAAALLMRRITIGIEVVAVAAPGHR